MSHAWHDLADQALGPDDTVEKTYSCAFDKQNGYLCLGRKKMVFVSVKGFLKKTYNLLLEAPYDEVTEVRLESRFRINLIHKDKTHIIETSDVSARIVVEAIKEMVKSSPLKTEVVFPGL
jgi:protein-arginine kinase